MRFADLLPVFNHDEPKNQPSEMAIAITSGDIEQ